jgi:hypothetical protein
LARRHLALSKFLALCHFAVGNTEEQFIVMLSSVAEKSTITPTGVQQFLDTFGYGDVKIWAPYVYALSDYIPEESEFPK